MTFKQTITLVLVSVSSALLFSACSMFGSSDDPYAIDGQSGEGTFNEGGFETNNGNENAGVERDPKEDAEAGAYADYYLDRLLNEISRVENDEKSKIADELTKRGPKNIELIRSFYEMSKETDPDTATQLELVVYVLERKLQESGGGEPALTPEDVETVSDDDNTVREAGDAKKGSGTTPPGYGLDDDSRDWIGDGDFDVNEVDRFVMDRLRRARQFHLDGDNDRAIKICEALLLLAPESKHMRLIQSLLLDARTGTQAERLIAGTLRVKRSIVRFSATDKGSLESPLEIELILANRSSRTIRLTLGDGGQASSSLVQIAREVTVRDMLNQTSSLADSESILVKGESIELLPGGSPISVSISIQDLSVIAPGIGRDDILSELRLSALMRPAMLEVQSEDDPKKFERLFRPIAFPTMMVYVMPSSFELAQVEITPVAFLKQALKDQKYQKLFLASFAIPEGSLTSVIDLMLDESIHNAGELELYARLNMVERLSGQNFDKDANKARDWWRKNRPYYVALGK